MRGKIKLKYPLSSVLEVIKYSKNSNIGVTLYYIHFTQVTNNNIPIGRYTIYKKNIYVSKKRGDEIHVIYTEVHREIFK